MQVKLFLLTALLSVTIFSSAQDFSSIDSLLTALDKEDKVAGSFLLAHNGKVLFEKAVGYSDRDTKSPLLKTTASNIASVGKMFTATLIMQLVEKGRLKLDVPIETYIPKIDIPNKNKITVHHLLTHTSGLGSYWQAPGYRQLNAEGKVTIDAAIDLITQLPLVFDEPGSRSEYSNAGYVILGKIIEQITGKTYASVLKENILDRAGMRNTFYNIDRSDMNGKAIGYSRAKPQDDWRSVQKDFPTALPDGGLFTTAGDLYKFDQALHGGKLIGKNILQLMKQHHSELQTPGGIQPYGYAMMVTDLGNGLSSFGHNGGTLGYNAEFRHYTKGNDNYTLIIVSNYERTTRPVFIKLQEMIVKGL